MNLRHCPSEIPIGLYPGNPMFKLKQVLQLGPFIVNVQHKRGKRVLIEEGTQTSEAGTRRLVCVNPLLNRSRQDILHFKNCI